MPIIGLHTAVGVVSNLSAHNLDVAVLVPCVEFHCWWWSNGKEARGLTHPLHACIHGVKPSHHMYTLMTHLAVNYLCWHCMVCTHYMCSNMCLDW